MMNIFRYDKCFFFSYVFIILVLLLFALANYDPSLNLSAIALKQLEGF